MNLRRAIFVFSLALVLHSNPAFSYQAGMTTHTDHEWCSDSDWGEAESWCEVRELSMSTDSLRVDAGGNGSIAVEAWDGDDVQVLARVVGLAREEDRAHELVRGIRLEVDGGEIRVRDDDRRGRRESAWTSFRIRVPRRTDLDLDTSNGSVRIEGVHGRIRFDTSNGSVELRRLAGDVRGETSNGSVRVELDGDRWDGDGLDVETSNGSVRIAVPEDYSAHLVTGTVNGRMELDFPVTVQGRLTGRLSVDLGDGGAPIRVQTTNGSVRVGRSL